MRFAQGSIAVSSVTTPIAWPTSWSAGRPSIFATCARSSLPSPSGRLAISAGGCARPTACPVRAAAAGSSPVPAKSASSRRERTAKLQRRLFRYTELHMRVYGFGVVALLLAACGGWGQGYAPDIAARKRTVAEGFEVSLVAAEPLVKQPVAIEFDDRGRLWVIQYLQYPNPAGLKRVKVDRYSRTTYDRVPDPPPTGPKGADRITILEDTDGDGRIDRARDFVNGLNLASAFAFGHGGVFVLQVPYLLFYPSRNGDTPDGDPEVLLKGFGMEDAHSVANSLTWGPDGWLYGCQGSTVTANIRGIEFQQGVWRSHPR